MLFEFSKRLVSTAALLAFTSCTSTNISGTGSENPNQYFIVSPVSSGDTVQKSPVIFFFQSSGGRNGLAKKWASWFAQYNIASVFIDSAGIRNRKNLFGVNYGKDLKLALNTVKDNPNLDLTRYAAMGFSRGGTGALESGSYLSSGHEKPDFIFSLYPGDESRCPNSYGESSKIFVFYGEKDDWGTHQGNRNACQRMASKYKNSTFIPLINAHHGYDGDWSGKWQCCGGRTFTSKPNPAALEKTRSIILGAVLPKWF